MAASWRPSGLIANVETLCGARKLFVLVAGARRRGGRYARRSVRFEVFALHCAEKLPSIWLVKLAHA
jgi:hypothetical protein